MRYVIAVLVTVLTTLAVNGKIYSDWDIEEEFKSTTSVIGFSVTIPIGNQTEDIQLKELVVATKLFKKPPVTHCELVQTLLKERLPLYENALMFCSKLSDQRPVMTSTVLLLVFDARHFVIDDPNLAALITDSCMISISNELENAFNFDLKTDRIFEVIPSMSNLRLIKFELSGSAKNLNYLNNEGKDKELIFDLRNYWFPKMLLNDVEPMCMDVVISGWFSQTAIFTFYLKESDILKVESQNNQIIFDIVKNIPGRETLPSGAYISSITELRGIKIMKVEAVNVKSVTNVCAHLTPKEISVIILDGQLLSERASVQNTLKNEFFYNLKNTEHHIEQSVPLSYRNEHQLASTSFGTRYFTKSRVCAVWFVYFDFSQKETLAFEQNKLSELFHNSGEGFTLATIKTARTEKCMVSRLPITINHYQVEGPVNINQDPRLVDRNSESYKKFEEAILFSLEKSLKRCTQDRYLAFRVNKIFWTKTGNYSAHSSVFFDARPVHQISSKPVNAQSSQLLSCKDDLMDEAYPFSQKWLFEETTNVICGRFVTPL